MPEIALSGMRSAGLRWGIAGLDLTYLLLAVVALRLIRGSTGFSCSGAALDQR